MGQLKYRALAQELQRGIRDGVWPPGSQLPTEAGLATSHAVSVNTVRRAMEVLAAEGWVERRQGAGTFVRAVPGAAHGRRWRIAAVLPERQWYFPPLLEGIEAAAARGRVALQVHCTGYGARGWQRLEDLLARLEGVDGLVLSHPSGSGPALADRARWLRELTLPYVLLERAPVDPGDPSEHVSTDRVAGVFIALEHLAALGHQRVGLVCRPGAPPSAQIVRGFAKGAAELGLDAVAVVEIEHQRRFGTGHMPTLAPLGERALRVLRAAGATAAVCFGDNEATMVIEAARRAGLAIPGGLSVIACEDWRAVTGSVALTSVVPEKFRLGRLAVEALLRRLAEPDAEVQQVWVRPRLAVRASTAAAGEGAAGPS
ncbi:GntR family transcriptional regulator [Mangrovactinospora gilvigrisea]|nr:substrate-binding domain-containing protein [Mangrovactinospora gilvigrisea]